MIDETTASASEPLHEPSWQSGYKTGYETGLSDGRAEFTNPAATSPAERAALARAPLPAQLPQKSWLDAPHDIANEHASAWAKGWNAARLESIAASLAGKVEQQ